MVLDTFLPNTQHYKVRIKGKSKESRSAPLHFAVVAIEKGAFGSPPPTKVANLTFYAIELIILKNGLIFPPLIKTHFPYRTFFCIQSV